jgi:hypothetical protein
MEGSDQTSWRSHGGGYRRGFVHTRRQGHNQGVVRCWQHHHWADTGEGLGIALKVVIMAFQGSTLTRLPIPQREIRIGEPRQTHIPIFGMIAWQGHDQSDDTDLSDRIGDTLGADAATWLDAKAKDAWRLVQRQHRPSHPRTVVRETLLVFTNAAEAEEFAWRFSDRLKSRKLNDLEMRQIEEVGHLRQTAAGGFYDPSRCSMPSSMKRIGFLLGELGELRERQRQIDLLRRSLGLELRKEWHRLTMGRMDTRIDSFPGRKMPPSHDLRRFSFGLLFQHRFRFHLVVERGVIRGINFQSAVYVT